MASIDSSPGRTKFGEDPAAYDFARPPYPPELFTWLREHCSLSATSECLEIGAGTGHGTLPILATPVGRVLAIEPDTRLAERLAAKTQGDTRLAIEAARFEEVDLAPAAFDFAFAAMSIHWLARMKAMARIRAALKPGGWFAMWWSVYHNPAAPDAFARASDHLFQGLEQEPKATGSLPAFALDFNSRMGEMRAAGFADVERRLFTHTVSFTPERIATLFATFSRVRMAPQETRDRLLAEVERIAREEFGGKVEREIPVSAFIGRKA